MRMRCGFECGGFSRGTKYAKTVRDVLQNTQRRVRESLTNLFTAHTRAGFEEDAAACRQQIHRVTKRVERRLRQ